jgi:N-formylglutamate amidohydrolase
MNGTASTIKTFDEIEKRLERLYDSYDEAVARGDSYVADMRKFHIEALEWVLGSREDF